MAHPTSSGHGFPKSPYNHRFERAFYADRRKRNPDSLRSCRPRPAAGKGKRAKPVLVIQPGWTWEKVTIEVTATGRIFICCDNQREEYRFPKKNGKSHSEGYSIIMGLMELRWARFLDHQPLQISNR
jgi:hypothetical protein